MRDGARPHLLLLFSPSEAPRVHLGTLSALLRDLQTQTRFLCKATEPVTIDPPCKQHLGTIPDFLWRAKDAECIEAVTDEDRLLRQDYM